MQKDVITAEQEQEFIRLSEKLKSLDPLGEEYQTVFDNRLALAKDINEKRKINEEKRNNNWSNGLKIFGEFTGITMFVATLGFNVNNGPFSLRDTWNAVFRRRH